MSNKLSLLKVENGKIIEENGKGVFLRGVNLGGWLMMEGYILHSRNLAVQLFEKKFARENGKKELANLLRLYRENFITAEDILRIKQMGANCIRLPFNYRLFYREHGYGYLDALISWCKKAGIWCILDLHAAPGAQNPDWHSDSLGKALFWDQKRFQEIYFRLWRRIAARYKNETTIAGYDVLNEAVTQKQQSLLGVYQEVTRQIRAEDPNHIIFLEGNHYGQQLKPLGRPKDNNTAYSIHVYLPIDFTFNFQPQLKYPGRIQGQYWNAQKLKQVISHYYRLAEKWRVPIYVGEFGINYRSPRHYGELKYLDDLLSCFKEFNFHWTYWTYKAAAGSVYPDGIYQYLANPQWIKREGPFIGWENLYALWKRHKRQIISSWGTEQFSENKNISGLLSRYF